MMFLEGYFLFEKTAYLILSDPQNLAFKKTYIHFKEKEKELAHFLKWYLGEREEKCFFLYFP